MNRAVIVKLLLKKSAYARSVSTEPGQRRAAAWLVEAARAGAGCAAATSATSARAAQLPRRNFMSLPFDFSYRTIRLAGCVGYALAARHLWYEPPLDGRV
jgi:hypothetical protein